MARFGEIPKSVCFWEIALAVASTVATVASTGVGIASAAGAFDKGGEEAAAPVDQAEALKAERMRRMRLGRKQTVATSARGTLGSPNVYRPGLRSTLG